MSNVRETGGNTALRLGTPSEAGMSATTIEALVQRAAGWVADGITPALVVAVARRGIIVMDQAFGRLRPEPEAPPVRLDSLFAIASLSKLMTTTLALMLVDSGELSLTRPVAEYIPGFAANGKDNVMVHHLLTHTSGLWDEDIDAHVLDKLARGAIPSAGDRRVSVCLAPRLNYLEHTLDAPLHTAPGQEMHYCSQNFAYLGLVVAAVSGQSLTKLGQERLFGPLGMTDTAYTLAPDRRDCAVVSPLEAPYGQALRELLTCDRVFGDVSVFSTARDLLVFGEMWRNQGRHNGVRILSRAATAKAMTNRIPGIGSVFNDEVFPEASWGWGWNVEGDKASACYGVLPSRHHVMHAGARRLYLWIDSENELVGVYLGVTPGFTPLGYPQNCFDLFANAVTAAIED